MDRVCSCKFYLFALLLIVFHLPIDVTASQWQDTCITNDICETAIEISPLVTDSLFSCLPGCNSNANPDAQYPTCGIDAFPTVWYKVTTDSIASRLNIRGKSPDISTPTIALFKLTTDCSQLEQIDLSSSANLCHVGWVGQFQTWRTPVEPNTTYLIAVIATDSPGGDFNICVNTVSNDVTCLVLGDVELTARSSGKDLQEPLLAGESVSVCMNVESYQTGQFNSCQWFQGMIPVFGAAWDPLSFDSTGQPFNTTVNGAAMGHDTSGLYGAARWDWFSDIDYHHQNDVLQVGDQDGNGTIDLCNNLYESCVDFGGMSGACCGPCYNTPGDLLPPGWFAYGINGSCAATGHPGVDWGDGDRCIGNMGPWSFCFDLKVASFPECLSYNPTTGLQLTYHARADAETGAWTGGPSVCLMDPPRTLGTQLICGQQALTLEPEILSPVCHGDIISFMPDEPDILHWYWDVDPLGLNGNTLNNGPNGVLITDTFYNYSAHPIEVTYHLRGVLDSIDAYAAKEVSFIVYPAININIPDTINTCSNHHEPFVLFPDVTGGTGNYEFVWLPTGLSTGHLTLIPPFSSSAHTLMISDDIGCAGVKEFFISAEPCIVGIDYDVSNEDPTHEESPLGDGNFFDPAISNRSEANGEFIRVIPTPAHQHVIIEWSPHIQNVVEIKTYDASGREVAQIFMKGETTNQKQINIQEFPQGVYWVLLKTQTGNHFTRILKF